MLMNLFTGLPDISLFEALAWWVFWLLISPPSSTDGLSKGLWTFSNGAEIGQLRLRRVAMRTFIGSCLTLLSTLGYL